MTKVSPYSHLIRLVAVLAAFGVVAGLIGWWAIPDSWNFEFDNWYRRDAIALNAGEPLIYGGNESCQQCHAAANKKLAQLKHRGLSCESCHGPLADHVRENMKYAPAVVDKSRWQCENCHAERINRPEDFPQFSKTGWIGKRVKKHTAMDDQTPCLKCHDAHDPTP